ncbi:M14 family zinc carboxypeptidase [Streptomyces sp. SID1034]|uniref:M14 family zinc carboxypeptidase n=1 Tax=Streptomyces sp. SID1034 TaxID=2690248 RepID=UPI00136B84B0|nr:M14 family zinc carboxypeptidase [Streptomyces sp. SID1034]MYV95940.1 hypothetical protein [Streptomyces sp. SID1034]
MKPPTRGRRTAVAALITLALAAPVNAHAQEPQSHRSPTTIERTPNAIPRQYEVRDADNTAARTLIASTGAAVDEARRNSVVITARPEQLLRVHQLGYTTQKLAGPPKRGGAAPNVEAGDFPAEDAGYHNYHETLAEIDAAVGRHPDIMAKKVIGSSAEGRDIVAVKISDNIAKDEAEPEVLFTAHQHAREHLTVEMALYLIREFGDKYGTDDRITKAVDGREIWIVPDVNPDGGEYDITGGQYRSWRKNRQPHEGTNAVGTDLNRNWNYK